MLAAIGRALSVLGGIWVVLLGVAWGLDALPESDTSLGGGVETSAAAAVADPAPSETGGEENASPAQGHGDAPAKAGSAGLVAHGDKAAVVLEGAALGQAHGVARVSVCDASVKRPTMTLAQLVGDPRPELLLGCGPLVQVVSFASLPSAETASDASPTAAGATRPLAPWLVAALETSDETDGDRVHALAPLSGDVTADGVTDLLFGYYREDPGGAVRDGELHLLRGNFMGGFDAPLALGRFSSVATRLGQLDSRPGLDLVAVHQANPLSRRPSEVRVFGGGAAFARMGAVQTGIGAEDVAVLDIDRDGALDVAVAVTDEHRVDFFYGDGSGRFGRAATLAAKGARRLVVADASGDGAPDVLVLGESLNYVPADANGLQLVAIEAVPAPTLGSGAPDASLFARALKGPPGDAVFADLDGNGRADLLVTYPGRSDGVPGLSSPVFLHATSHGAFEARPLFELEMRDGPVGARFDVERLAVGDLDADGHADAVVLGRVVAPRTEAGGSGHWEALLLTGLGVGDRHVLHNSPAPLVSAPLSLRIPVRAQP